MVEPRRNWGRWVIVAGVLGWPELSGAQTNALEFGYGAWKPGSVSTTWSAGYRARLMGPFDYSLALAHVSDRSSPIDRTQTGLELSLGIRRDGSGAYGVASVGVGMKHAGGNLDASWSAGAGWAVPVLP